MEPKNPSMKQRKLSPKPPNTGKKGEEFTCAEDHVAIGIAIGSGTKDRGISSRREGLAVLGHSHAVAQLAGVGEVGVGMTVRGGVGA